MKHKSYRRVITLIAIGVLGTTFGQKFDKKFTENFKVNKDVEIVINASNTDINVTTWDKNEVQVEAFVEIEGLSKEKAEKYFKNWNFEALGNKSKVSITSKGSNTHEFDDNFIFFNDMDFTFPDIQLSNFDSIVIPEMNFDYDFDFNFDFNFDDLEKNMNDDDDFSFEWEHNGDKISIKSKKEWEAFKKSKKYKELKEKMSVEQKKLKEQLEKSKEQMKKSLSKVKLEYKYIDKEKIKKSLAKAKEHLKEMKINFSSGSNDLMIDGKKIKIKKRLEIKVPKTATFNLNTRHCKVKLPNTVASGSVKYGTFDANNLNGGRLTINYSPVNINNLNACTLFLNNVTDAKIASVTNTTLSNNSSGVKIIKINENVHISDKFGELTINSFNPNFGQFVLNLSQSNATVILGDVLSNFKFNVNKVKLNNQKAGISNINPSNKNIIKVNGDYSQIVIK
ncbi:hypothetical protein MC378_02460 [Polaribacter sp. MSW13]|uniref:Adhesin domain-containing protein n=1 Tax=Polaribacter marinus TaxID=2916838 RepID=A0A9X2ALN6_9FLAO|nr:hypothetical protein [Polaribacter marinus]MCI2228014.1 hypothetical protein [Polaribacter marinus]